MGSYMHRNAQRDLAKSTASADSKWHTWLRLAEKEAKRRFALEVNDLGGAKEFKKYYWDQNWTVEETMDHLKSKYALSEQSDFAFNPSLPGADPEVATLKKGKK